ncbi:uncharacterized protein DSM5745_00711 [Aspergillus mulundensis]|uniref:Uncharacterized protein n=1 Tax=Aspergillus mulundensis TaxID=1810919 RepID=A0A3D8T4D9_9EURO|nr:hypothetical protein DSM5745_00711 [Aspergillus mulundensis]RDW93389.1 hypothetical protein DSM5745_00711 [Aspergillus mulundensis]
MQSQALIPCPSGPGFSQQGSLDWIQLVRSSYSIPREILSRFSQAGVEPLTLTVGQAIFSRFVLPPCTQQKIEETLATLKPFSSYGQVLWFGFGVKHVARLLVESEQGMICLALCGSLSVSYEKFYCAQVLRSMTQLQNASGDLSPSISQWSQLINICSGTLLSSDFPNIVEGFSRLWYNAQNPAIWQQQGGTPPDSLGQALLTLFDIASGSLQSATFVGGPDCAWIAAVAEWILCLSVEVRDAESDESLYRKVGDGHCHEAQVTILRAFHREPMVRLKDKICFLPSGVSDFHATTAGDKRVFARARSSWETILSDTFPGDALQRLLSSEAVRAFFVMPRF